MKITIPQFLIALLLCLASLPKVEAVVPPPDGGYPGLNTAEGQNALFNLTTGQGNTAVGWFSLFSNIEGDFNTATGVGTLLFNTADANTAFGAAALLSNTTGADNTAVGENALFGNTAGNSNTAIGTVALQNSTGSNNTALGNRAGLNVTTANNVIAIGSEGANVSDSCYIGNIWGANSSGGIAVLVNSGGKLGTVVSSRRFKEEIKPMEGASEALFALEPVTFRYHKEIDPAGISQLGLVAEDVEKVNPDLVVRDKEGKPYSVRYDQVNAMLLNEFLKEHRKVEKLEATVASLAATVEKQAAQIRKVNAQIELSKPPAKMASTNP